MTEDGETDDVGLMMVGDGYEQKEAVGVVGDGAGSSCR